MTNKKLKMSTYGGSAAGGKKPIFKEADITLIDKNDKVIGAVKYREMRRNNLWHRLTSILVFSSNGQILMQKRAPWLHSKPNQWECRIGGHVDPGETYKHGALRELKEEMGITILPYKLKLITKEKIDTVQTKYYRKVYTCVYDGKIKIDKTEVADYKWVNLDNIKTFTKDKISINGLKAITTYKQWLKKQKKSRKS